MYSKLFTREYKHLRPEVKATLKLNRYDLNNLQRNPGLKPVYMYSN